MLYAAYITSAANPVNKFRVLVHNRAEAKAVAAKIPFAKRKITMVECRVLSGSRAASLLPLPQTKRKAAKTAEIYTASLLFLDDRSKAEGGSRILLGEVEAASFGEAVTVAYKRASQGAPPRLADIVVSKGKEYRRYLVNGESIERYLGFSAAKLAALMKSRKLSMNRLSKLTGASPEKVKNG